MERGRSGAANPQSWLPAEMESQKRVQISWYVSPDRRWSVWGEESRRKTASMTTAICGVPDRVTARSRAFVGIRLGREGRFSPERHLYPQIWERYPQAASATMSI